MSGKADISSLASTLSNLGYGKVVTGSYVGDGTGIGLIYNNGRKIELPITPICMIIIGNDVIAKDVATQYDFTSVYIVSNNGYVITSCYTCYTSTVSRANATVYLNENILTVLSMQNNVFGPNKNGIVYNWLAW